MILSGVTRIREGALEGAFFGKDRDDNSKVLRKEMETAQVQPAGLQHLRKADKNFLR